MNKIFYKILILLFTGKIFAGEISHQWDKSIVSFYRGTDKEYLGYLQLHNGFNLNILDESYKNKIIEYINFNEKAEEIAKQILILDSNSLEGENLKNKIEKFIKSFNNRIKPHEMSPRESQRKN